MPLSFHTRPSSDRGGAAHKLADGALPASKPGETSEVTRDGADAGACVDTYVVYVSRDGGPFRIWRNDTKASSRTYRGEIGSTYSFAVTAVDGVGRREPGPIGIESKIGRAHV